MAEATEVQAESDPQAQKRLNNLFNKGFAAFERGSLDMAIDLLYTCVELSPDFFRARKFLRAASLQRFTKDKPGALKLKLAEIGALPQYLKTLSWLHRGRHAEALLAAERLIAQAPLSVKYVDLAAQCAIAAGQPESAIMYLETALQVDMQNHGLMLSMANAYRSAEQWVKAREVLNALINLKPLDAGILSLLKDTDARIAMAGTWDSAGGGDFRKLVKDQATAGKLDMENKAVVDGSDAEVLIAEQRKKIEADPKNLNYYRALARLLQQQKRFDEAVEVMVTARAINPTDPELDRMLASLRIQSFDARVEAANAAGEAARAEALEHERNQFVFDDLIQRVERYPNDLRLRYELGQQYLQYESYDDAIQQFQLAQRSPKERSGSLYGLARCFRLKGQVDMAVMQLETALDQLPVMNDERKQILFELGEISEETGNIERAFTIYRELYGADIGYRDIAAKMERIYTLRKPKPEAGTGTEATAR
jgi:tetratricopeptide (TPR) repeat protein